MSTSKQSETLMIERVPFHGDHFELVRWASQGYVHLKPICEGLGVSYPAQYRKLKEAKWGGVAIIATPDERGRPQRLAMISIDAVPMWLATIHPSKVAFEVRAKLEAYQLEAAKVLAAWFLGPQEDRLSRMGALERELGEVRRQRDALAFETARDTMAIVQLRAEAHGLSSELANAIHPFDKGTAKASGYMTIREFVEHYHVKDSLGYTIAAKYYPAIARTIGMLYAALGFDPIKPPAFVKRRTNMYPVHVLLHWKNDRELQSLVPSETYEAFHAARPVGI